MLVIVIPEFGELARKIDGIPEQYPIEVLAPDRADQTLDERMRNRDVRTNPSNSLCAGASTRSLPMRASFSRFGEVKFGTNDKYLCRVDYAC